MSRVAGHTSKEVEIVNKRDKGTATQGTVRQGEVRQRPPRGKSQAHPGVQPLSAFSQGSQKFQPLPEPIGRPPFHYDLATALPGIDGVVAASRSLVFHVVGDTGGIKQPEYQASVAAAMKADLLKSDPERPRFFYHLGDVVYYNGQIEDYYDQFYEPYDHYDPPLIAIPGNHDGDPINNDQTSLDGWVRYFMSPQTRINPESHDAPRSTMSLPNPFFTLNCPLVTIVGMYSNVPEHGSIDSAQQQWLTNEFATAPTDKALILAVHHPIYSFDDHHSGSPRMADALQHAINDSRRVPNLVLTAHVHNYQRIEREIVDAGPTPFLVAGHGGYYHMHGMNIDSPLPAGGDSHAKHTPPVKDADTGAQLIYSNHTNHGYCTLTITPEKISGTVTLVAEEKYPAVPNADSFSYPAGPITLPKGAVVSL